MRFGRKKGRLRMGDHLGKTFRRMPGHRVTQSSVPLNGYRNLGNLGFDEFEGAESSWYEGNGNGTSADISYVTDEYEGAEASYDTPYTDPWASYYDNGTGETISYVTDEFEGAPADVNAWTGVGTGTVTGAGAGTDWAKLITQGIGAAGAAARGAAQIYKMTQSGAPTASIAQGVSATSQELLEELGITQSQLSVATSADARSQLVAKIAQLRAALAAAQAQQSEKVMWEMVKKYGPWVLGGGLVLVLLLKK